MRTAQHEIGERFKYISGIINADGSIQRGVGFAQYKQSTGIYQIVWHTPVKAVINVVASIQSGTSSMFCIPDVHSGPPMGPQGFLVKVYTQAVGLADGNWIFTATVIPQ